MSVNSIQDTHNPQSDKQHVLVFGAGAVGCLLGGLLRAAGHEVAFVGRKPIVDALKNHGMQITGLWGEVNVPRISNAVELVSDLTPASPLNLILITTKTYATMDAIQACMPLVRENTRVCSIQNGVGNLETIAEHVGWPNTLGARIITGVEIDVSTPGSPAQVRVTVHGDAIRFGHPQNLFPMDELESIALMWKAAGIPVEATSDLLKYIWAKVFYNAALNPLGAILGVCYGRLAEQSGTRNTMDRIIHEAFAATHAHDIEHFWPDASSYLKAFYGDMIPKTAGHFPSMLRDIEQGRRTEIGALNAAIVRLGDEKGIDVSTNRCIVEMLEFLEQTKSRAAS